MARENKTAEDIYEIASRMADEAGIYGIIEYGEHKENCNCRLCFESNIIKEYNKNSSKMEQGELF